MAYLVTDPICLATDRDGDIIVPLQWARGLDAVVQGCRTRLRMVRGEWFLNRDEGVRYLPNDIVPAAQSILGQKFDRLRCDADMRGAILKTPAVVEVLLMSIEFNARTRAVTVRWQARAEFGDTPVDVLTRAVGGLS